MPLSFELLGAADVVFEIGVAAIDQNVCRPACCARGLHGLLGGGAGGNHEPGHARLAQLAHEIVERGRCNGAFGGNVLHVVGAEIGDNHFVAAAHQAARHVGTHLAQPYHSQSAWSAPCLEVFG